MQAQAMKAAAGSAEYELKEAQLFSLSKAQGRRIECLAGRTWITVQGESSDFMLRPGNVFVVPNNGLVLIESIGPGKLRLKPALPAQSAWRGALRLTLGQPRLPALDWFRLLK